MSSTRVSLLFVCALLGACMTDVPSPEVGAEVEALGDAPITWAACPSDFASECAWIAQPLDHNDPLSRALPIFVSRRPARSGHAKAQLWLLQGGPGGSGNIFGNLTDGLSQLLPDFEFYVIEHRGVGESARLGCDTYESLLSEEGTAITDNEWPACVEELKRQWHGDLAHFTTTQDAYDLGSLIAQTRGPGQQVFVYGVSYGTTRALRFLQTHPDLVDGVILDSVVSPSVQYLSQFDAQFDVVAQDLAELCAEDPVCGEKLGRDPWSEILDLLQRLQDGHCPQFLYRSIVQPGFAQLLMSRDLRAHIFPLTYRLNRCTPEDVGVIENYFSVVSQLFSDTGKVDRESLLLQKHVALSELWEEPAPSFETLSESCDSLVLCPGVGIELGQVYPYWPRYERDEFVGKWPETDTPILALNGTLDPQTPLETALAAKAHLRGEHQHFVTVPWSPHGVAFETPVATPKTPPCGVQLIQKFVTDPKAEPDTSCLSDLLPPFSTDPELDAALFGGSDIWENPERALESRPSAASLNARAFQVRPLSVQALLLP
jgi:pimeloyl-ACP methyl ester carboxylesterase